LAVDRNSKITKNDINKILIYCQNLQVIFWQLIESSNTSILGFKKVLINCQNPQVLFWQLIKCTVG
jgi:hypothetical protein